MVLRQVCGAGLRSLVTLLCTDFLLTVLAALVVGMVLVELLMPIFLRYSLIQDADFRTTVQSCSIFCRYR